MPQPRVTAIHEEDKPLAKKIEALLLNETRLIGFKEMNDLQERTVPIQGGDFWHVEWDPEGGFHVIDWVHGTKGNASADAARTYLILALEDREGAECYLDLFCQKTGTKKSYVQDWLPLVAAAQLTKKRPEEEGELRSWLQICDHM